MRIPPKQIAQAGATTGQLLQWSGAAWVPTTNLVGMGGAAIAASQVDQTASRAFTTIYQNNTGTTLELQIGISGTGIEQILVDSFSPPTTVVAQFSTGAGHTTLTVVVPPGHYYKLNQFSGSSTMFIWIETALTAGSTQVDVPQTQNVLQSALPVGGVFLAVNDTGYFVYLGKTNTQFVPKYVKFQVSTGGSGAQTAEVGFFSTPAAPNAAAQSLTKLVATGTVDDLTTTGAKRNTAAFSTAILGGVHLWAGIRTAMAATQPTFVALSYDMEDGQVLSVPTPGALTGAGPFAGAVIAASLVGVTPALHGLLV
jgi:hypothetical protein